MSLPLTVRVTTGISIVRYNLFIDANASSRDQ